MDNSIIPEIRIESLDASLEDAHPSICESTTHKKAARENALPLSIIAAALVLITVSLALHTSLFAMAANHLRTISPTEFLMQLILPAYTAEPIEKPNSDTEKDADKTSEENPPAPADTEEPPEDDPPASGDTIRDKNLSSNAENGFSLSNQTKYTPDLWALYGVPRMIKTADELAAEYGEDAPLVLILHTHGTESYANGSTVTSDTGFRSHNPQETVVAVGGVITEVLESAGIPVVHLEEMFDMENWSGAYENSSAAVREVLKEYPSIQYIFDEIGRAHV